MPAGVHHGCAPTRRDQLARSFEDHSYLRGILTLTAIRRWKLAFRLVIVALLIYGVWRTLGDAADQFAQYDFRWSALRHRWLLAAGLAYLAGMLPCWWFWHRVLQAMGGRPLRRQTLCAFYVGHLGKYVPGKAMVVVIRTALIRGPRVDTLVAAVSVFVETLTMMAIGALVAAGLLLTINDESWLFWLAVALFGLAGFPTLPPVFRRVVRAVGVQRSNPPLEKAISALRLPVLATGWVVIAGGWFLMGASLWAVLKAMPIASVTASAAGMSGFQTAALLTATVALAMVAGFLSLLPGGIGVRELVVVTLLAPVYGEVDAILSAVLLRVIWLIAELVASGCLYLVARPRREPDTVT